MLAVLVSAVVVAATPHGATSSSGLLQRPQISCQTDAHAADWFAEDDRSWSAAEVISSVEALRQGLRVPFYIYEGVHSGVDFTEQTRNLLDECPFYTQSRGTPIASNTGGDTFFIGALQRHPWRVRRPEDATIIVMPVEMALEIDILDGVTGKLPNMTGSERCHYNATQLLEVSSPQRTRIQAHRPQGSWGARLSSAPFRWSSWAPE